MKVLYRNLAIGVMVVFFITSDKYRIIDIREHINPGLPIWTMGSQFAVEIPSAEYLNADENGVSVLPEGWITHKTTRLVLNPYENFKHYRQYVGNYHTHTTESDGRIYGAEVIHRYFLANYNILILTDHDRSRPTRSPRENDGQPFVNTWPWTIFEGDEPYQAPVGSLARDPVSGVVPALNMLTVEGVELSRRHHLGSFDNDFTGGDVDYTDESQIAEVQERNGLCMLYHPGRYDFGPDWYVSLFKKYHALVGLEVFNQNDRYPGDRDLWDEILTESMPGTPVWGYSNDDMHREEHLFRNYNWMLMPSLDVTSWRSAMQTGRSYFCYEYTGSGQQKCPRIYDITTDDRRITLHTDEADIEWIYNKQVVGTGPVFDFASHAGNYVRAETRNSFGLTCTQPFGFIDT